LPSTKHGRGLWSRVMIVIITSTEAHHHHIRMHLTLAHGGTRHTRGAHHRGRPLLPCPHTDCITMHVCFGMGGLRFCSQVATAEVPPTGGGAQPGRRCAQHNGRTLNCTSVHTRGHSLRRPRRPCLFGTHTHAPRRMDDWGQRRRPVRNAWAFIEGVFGH
jgi:hypothetical protein